MIVFLVGKPQVQLPLGQEYLDPQQVLNNSTEFQLNLMC